MDIALALEALLPGAIYQGSLTENTDEAYDTIEWHDERPKPSISELSGAFATVQAKTEASAEVQEIRQQMDESFKTSLTLEQRAQFMLVRLCAKAAAAEGDFDLSDFIITNPLSIIPPSGGVPDNLKAAHDAMVLSSGRVKELSKK